MAIDSSYHLAQRVTGFAAATALLLALCKIAFFVWTGSLIIALSAWDSAMDACVSLINRKIIKLSQKKADHDHPYGHGRVESIAALGQGALITGGAIAIMVASGKQLMGLSEQPPLPTHPFVLIGFFCFAFFVSLIVSMCLGRYGKRWGSPALCADAQHYAVDMWTNLASAIGVGAIAVFQAPWLDPAIAIVFALYILYSAKNLLKTSIDELMDRDIDAQIKADVCALIHQTEPLVIDVHQLRGRKIGPAYHFDCHVTLPEHLDFHTVHDIVENLETTLHEFYEGSIVIHADPSEPTHTEVSKL